MKQENILDSTCAALQPVEAAATEPLPALLEMDQPKLLASPAGQSLTHTDHFPVSFISNALETEHTPLHNLDHFEIDQPFVPRLDLQKCASMTRLQATAVLGKAYGDHRMTARQLQSAHEINLAERARSANIIQELTRDIEITRKAHTRVLEQSKESASLSQATQEGLELRLRDAQRRIDVLSAERVVAEEKQADQTREMLHQQAQYEKETAEFNARVDGLQHALDIRKEEMMEIRVALAEAQAGLKATDSENTAMKHTQLSLFEQLTFRNGELERMTQEAGTATEMRSALEKSLQKAGHKVEELEVLLERRGEELEQAQASFMDQMRVKAQRVGALEMEVKQATARSDGYMTQVETAVRRNERLEGDLSSANQEIDRLGVAVQACEKQMADCAVEHQAELEAALGQMDELRRAAEKERADRERIVMRNQVLMSDNLLMKVGMETMRGDLKQLRDDHLQMAESIKGLRAELRLKNEVIRGMDELAPRSI